MAESFHPLQDTDKIRKEGAFSNVNPKSNIGDFAMLLIAEVNKGREQGGREVVYAKISGILKYFKGVGFTGAGQPTDNDQVQPGHGVVTASVDIPEILLFEAAVSLTLDSSSWNALSSIQESIRRAAQHIKAPKERGSEIHKIHVRTRS